MLSFADRKRLYNLCRPAEPLDPGDPRNVDLDALGTESGRVRGVAWAETLASRVALSDRPALELYTGLPGSGKSTELRRLAQILGDAGGADLVPVLIDAEDALDLTSTLDVPDILSAIVHNCELATLQLEGLTPEAASERALQEGYLTRLWAWLTRTDVELTTAEFALAEGARFGVEMKTRPTFRRRVREVVARNLSAYLRDARQELERLDARVRARHRQGLVVLFDSLEKLQPTTTHWREVFESAEQLFAGGAPYLRLPVHAVYTVPASLVARGIKDIRFMPMVKLADREGQPFPAGFAAMRDMVRRRVDDDALASLFGPQFEERVGRLIYWSGGYPRDLIRLLQGAVAQEAHPLADAAFDRLLSELRDEYRLAVPRSAYGWLARVAVDHDPALDDEEHRPIANQMLASNTVLWYRNASSWVDLHPAVKEIPGVREAIEQLRRERAGPA